MYFALQDGLQRPQVCIYEVHELYDGASDQLPPLSIQAKSILSLIFGWSNDLFFN